MKLLRNIFHWKVLTIIALIALPLIALTVDKALLHLVMEVIAQFFWTIVCWVLFVKFLYFVFDSLTGYKDESK